MDGEEGALLEYLGSGMDGEEGDCEEGEVAGDRWRMKRDFQEKAPEVRTKNSWPEGRTWVGDIEDGEILLVTEGLGISGDDVSATVKER